ncbi:probable L-gulonolactone oxidase 6 [Magnolia sinica]|uniref:probable L-gulonolactone oxidase 6 n=1 Tax=Magnolia sinica TaxID=86752 RepID=UPI002657B748|nr:probable L-gulonolactone oxidase 6 [Magnolia sinica]
MAHLKGLFFILLVCMVRCSPPEEPIQCSSSTTNCTITNSYGAFPDRSICRAGEVVYPTNEAELTAAVAKATMRKRKMKVATRYSHSIPKLVCPGGDDGLLISTRFLNRILGVDATAMTMTVESGVTLREVIDGAAKAGLALPYTPYWWGLTIGGLLATGAHGSSLWGVGSSVHDHVVGLRIVTPAASLAEGYAKVRLVMVGHPDMDAVKVSLGVLGVISQVTLKLQPLFKRSITNMGTSDSDLGNKAVGFGNEHEFADMTWYPSQRKVVYRMDDRISSNVSGNGRNNFIGFRSTSALTLAIVRSTEEGHEATNNPGGKCTDSKVIVSALMMDGYGLMNDGILFKGYPVVGYHNNLQSSGGCLDSLEDACLTVCPWDPRIKGEFFHQTTITIGLSKVQNFIQDVQKLRDIVPNAMCGLDLYNGILIRYVKASSAYLGKQEDGLDFDISYYRSKDPTAPRLHEDILEEVEQMALFKYGGLPHWGKNRNLAFDGVINKYGKIGEFLKVKQTYDPLGLFSSEWTDQVLGINGRASIIKEGCALEGLCICSEDLHCAPNKGYYCRSGKVYTDARVCTRLTNSH